MSNREPAPLGAASGSVRIPKTAELVAARLRTEIVRGQLKEGDTLPPETTLMEEFCVSRPTLREAYRLLEAESLIQLKRGARGGAVVSVPDISVAARYVGLILQMSGTTLDEIYSARMVFEPTCARLFTERRTDNDLDDLRACIDRMCDITEEDLKTNRAPEIWAELTGSFQSIITERCGNNALSVQAGVLRDIVTTHQKSALDRGARRKGTWPAYRRNLRSYEKFVSIVAVGDGVAAEEHWAAHLRSVGKILFSGGVGRASIVELFS
ncbi:FadR/GntR family transcriptional regulator [Rhodococcus artemisiae]|uniref:GntR family transcriptional regulator n=1 Tax=Rhodococcus artemisiae TaxID=714159 RepID=A0ABU7L6L4_9NOCA|nr:GntR family transcriptional regulator [Rhodococcus artemisiae]MEE2057186.1 GntR family transcriptional regulator [Rhodococcus artemisiae]